MLSSVVGAQPRFQSGLMGTWWLGSPRIFNSDARGKLCSQDSSTTRVQGTHTLTQQKHCFDPLPENEDSDPNFESKTGDLHHL